MRISTSNKTHKCGGKKGLYASHIWIWTDKNGNIASGKLTVRYVKSSSWIGKSTINRPFSIAMWNSQRVWRYTVRCRVLHSGSQFGVFRSIRCPADCQTISVVVAVRVFSHFGVSNFIAVPRLSSSICWIGLFFPTKKSLQRAWG